MLCAFVSGVTCLLWHVSAALNGLQQRMRVQCVNRRHSAVCSLHLYYDMCRVPGYDCAFYQVFFRVLEQRSACTAHGIRVLIIYMRYVPYKLICSTGESGDTVQISSSTQRLTWRKQKRF